MKPSEALEQLMNKVDIEWYIGQEATKAIKSACEEKQATKPPTKKA